MGRGRCLQVVALCFLATLFMPCTAAYRTKRQVNGCSAQSVQIDAAQSKPDFHTTFTFSNDSNTGVLMTWAGNQSQVIILITTLTEDHFFYVKNYPSNIYTSVDGGKTFQNRTASFGHSFVVMSDNGLQGNPFDPDHLLLLTVETTSLVIWVTFDGGMNWEPSPELSFDISMSDPLPFKFNPRSATDEVVGIKHWLFSHAIDNNLYISTNGGLTWSQLATRVLEATWGTTTDAPSAIYALIGDDSVISKYSGSYKPKYGCCTLRKLDLSTNGKQQDVLTNVFSFGVFENYIFASVWDSSPEGRLQNRRALKVSSDGGNSFQVVQLPTATPDTFYSVLTVDSKQVFIHVDEPGDTGRGALYVSDANGTIYSESLHNHFYPDYLGMSDFYHVKSMRGTYLTTVIETDSTMHSVISFDRGAEWKRVSKPINVDCDSADEANCGLQITGVYSLSNSHSPVSGSLPLSSATARGIVFAHGHTSGTIQADDPDVYLSNDGGYTWRRVLIGPHHYEIAHFGALLVATPIAGSTNTDDSNVLHFSLDGGSCWHQMKFDNEDFTVTGVVTAPGNRELSVALWGYTTALKWRVHVINFDELLTSKCTNGDYETWIPHVPGGIPTSVTEGCVLGLRDTYKRLRDDSWCVADLNTDLVVSSVACPCTFDDYDCAYGYYRKTTSSEECVRHPNINTTEVCLNGDLDEVISDGYIKIPGDVCVGGFVPHYLDEQLTSLKKICDEDDKINRDLTADDDGHLGSDKYQQLVDARKQDAALVKENTDAQKSGVVIAVCVIVGGVLGAGLILILLKLNRLRRLSRMSTRYSRLANADDDSARSRLLPLSISANDRIDEDDPMVSVNPVAPVPSLAEDELLVHAQEASVNRGAI